MNAPFSDRSHVRDVFAAVGARHGLVITDLLPTGLVGHPSDAQPVVLLATATRDDLSLLDVGSAEVELHDQLGFATRILLRSDLEDVAAARHVLAEVRDL